MNTYNIHKNEKDILFITDKNVCTQTNQNYI